MKDWEKKYISYNYNEEDEIINELEKKVQDKTISKEEYKELKIKKNIRDNISKVSNVLELRDKLANKNKEIKEEIERRKTLNDAIKEQEKLENRLTEILEEENKLNKEFKNPNLKDDDKNRILETLDNLKNEKDDNNKLFSENQKLLDNVIDKNENELSKVSVLELEEQKFDISTKISKCNMVCNNLMKGLTWDAIEIKLDKWKDKKFTAPEKTPIKDLNTIKEAEKKEVEKKKVEKKETEKKEVKKKEVEKKVVKKEESDEKLPVVKGFFGRFPKLKKAFNFIKEKLNKLVKRKTPYEKYIKNKYKNKKNTGPRKTTEGFKKAIREQEEFIKQGEEKRKEELKEKRDEKPAEKRDVTNSTKNNEFKEYLKLVAENGIKSAEKKDYQEYKASKEKKMAENGEEIIHASEDYRKFAKQQDER